MRWKTNIKKIMNYARILATLALIGCQSWEVQRDGKPLYEIDGDSENIYNEEGDKIVGGFDLVTDIKKLD